MTGGKGKKEQENKLNLPQTLLTWYAGQDGRCLISRVDFANKIKRNVPKSYQHVSSKHSYKYYVIIVISWATASLPPPLPHDLWIIACCLLLTAGEVRRW